MSIPGYDAWKLATPPEYEWDSAEQEEASIECPACGGGCIDPMPVTGALICGECWMELWGHE